MSASRFYRTENGEIRLGLPEEEQALLRDVAARIRALIADGDDPALRRLSPPAHSDPELDRQYRELTGGQLTAGRDRALELLEATVDRDVLSAQEADQWLQALTSARLVLGTRLDITEDLDWDALDPRDPRAPDLALYAYLTWIEEQLVEASV